MASRSQHRPELQREPALLNEVGFAPPTSDTLRGSLRHWSGEHVDARQNHDVDSFLARRVPAHRAREPIHQPGLREKPTHLVGDVGPDIRLSARDFFK